MDKVSDVGKAVSTKDFYCKSCYTMGITNNNRCTRCKSSNIILTPSIGPPTNMAKEMYTENPRFSDGPLENYE